jgi:Ni,Fe-hydrogenase III small subunit
MNRFERSLGIRHLVCGSCNACEHEMNALAGPDYDITARGWDIVASPRHADVITVTGPMTEAMETPAQQTIEAAARPCVIVAIGDCAIGDGTWSNDGSGAGTQLGAVVNVAGCPPSPSAIVQGLARAAKLL